MADCPRFLFLEIQGSVMDHASTLAYLGRYLDHALRNSIDKGLPMIAMSPIQGKFSSMLVTLSSARHVLEIRTLGAYSSIWLARHMKGRGTITSLEIDPHRRDVAIENLQFAGIKVPDEVDVQLGAALDILPRLRSEIASGQRPLFDFVFIDADWGNQGRYFEYAVELTSKGGVIYVDNAVRNLVENGMPKDGQSEEDVDNLVKQVGLDGRVDAVVLQTVGAKEYDGFLLAVVK
ncbi:S-adenosyl-L-methionine-dependent methyltransferase [Aaosphaeria arxii CBS 175.79]|uniref:S-adenosyl-L-methionine-dependent methyltransferase n=1 Tax=Aaosphaeria arxii CBS 175.79 TaxID=1450172 RepID=A0A6A5X5R7_9PLEO|nr:S-adenosyl-L-methionine-dependent methyltransferase [Aaosphaeria arxii CBS 175.79]KAF2008240.1 S-adenosyl-L-methionine-dependent methyltransferase [Aaosphaeria arxii CBS 175.79]